MDSRFLGEAASREIEGKLRAASETIALWSAYFGLPTLVCLLWSAAL
jgi:hypothetical protein